MMLVIAIHMRLVTMMMVVVVVVDKRRLQLQKMEDSHVVQVFEVLFFLPFFFSLKSVSGRERAAWSPE